ncbi:MAG: tetratricopeptide repeat protein, partial [Chloroflexota bacterium]|nr:tetratricopeptide repeat protein [Chloroflexota bacterium]
MLQTSLHDYLQTTEDTISSGRIDEALNNCQYILSHFPESLEAQRLLGEVYLAQGDLENARQTFDWILTNDPENVIVYCDRALISERQSDIDTALDCYQQAYELSRGNSQIRQKFNQLSEKVGQQGFIFSRAGLARLYMRGDLLPQAIQEWEGVLSANPDRLDARTGLLEAYWREGQYDRVEQVGTELLRDIPACLKALLLLAHVTYAQNTPKAQALLKQVETLDPEMVMAQELFSDLIASHPDDPFLALIKKASIAFPETVNAQISSSNSANTPDNTSTFSDSFMRWSSLDNIIEPQEDYQTTQETSPFASWSNNGTSDFDAWNNLEQNDHHSVAETTSPASSKEDNYQPSPDTTPFSIRNSGTDSATGTPAQTDNQQEGTQTDVPLLIEPDSWHNIEPDTESNEMLQNENSTNAISSASLWENTPDKAEAQEDLEMPAWLSMLTQSEHHPLEEPPPQFTETTLPEVEQASPTVQTSIQQEAKPQSDISSAAEENFSPSAPVPASISDEEESAFFFGPEWLKSLGATTIDNPTSAELLSPTLSTEAKSEQNSIPVSQSEPTNMSTSEELTNAAQEEDAMVPPPSFSTEQSEVSPFFLTPLGNELQPTQEDWLNQSSEATQTAQPAEPDSAASWQDQFSQTPPPIEQHVVTTLEDLE